MASDKNRSAVIVIVDRLGAGALGPYGNTWIDTPQFNRLAARGLLCETVLAESPELADAYRSYWTGRHVLEADAPDAASLPALAKGRGIATTLVTDEKALGDVPHANAFAEHIAVPHGAGRRAEELDQSSFGQVFLTAIDAIRAVQGQGLFWIHSRGMSGPWDAPLALRNQFAAEDDPLPPDFLEPPEKQLSENHDPDELLGIAHAYAGQVTLLDACLGALLDELDELPGRGERLVVISSPRGYPLGEHRRVGSCDNALYTELLQTPLIISRGDGIGARERTQTLVQPCDFYNTFAEWLSGSSPRGLARSGWSNTQSPNLPQREIICSIGPNQRSVRTPVWFWRESTINGESQRELFAKPDDRWEVNEIASRCGDVPELLAAKCDELQAALAAGEAASLAPLPEILTSQWR